MKIFTSRGKRKADIHMAMLENDDQTETRNETDSLPQLEGT